MTITLTSPNVPDQAPGIKMANEIGEQPRVFAGLLDSDRRQFVALADIIKKASPRFVLLAARGTSDHAALYAKYLIEISLGLPVGLA